MSDINNNNQKGERAQGRRRPQDGEMHRAGSKTARPEGKTRRVDAGTAHSEGNVHRTEKRAKRPEGKTSRPEEKVSRPEGNTNRANARTHQGERTTRPEGKTTRPEGKASRPEGRNVSAGNKTSHSKSRPVNAKAKAAHSKKKGSAGKKKKKHTVSNIILVIAILVFVISGVQLVCSFLPYFQGGAEYDELKELVVTTKKDDSDSDSDSETSVQIDFDQLKKINSDTVAWIRFDEPSVINYPVVRGTDNTRYLTATFQVNDNKLGAIFEDYQNSSDFTDQNTIIYGHNLKVGGEMFSQLKNYEEEDYYKKYPYFYIYTPDGKTRKYQIFSAGVVKDTAQNYQITFSSTEDFESYLQICKSSSAYDTGVSVDKNSTIVSLSTCTNVKEDERFLVQGVLIEEK